MEGVWLVSYIVLWCLTVVLGLVMLAHSRLLGLLHHRLSPAGAKSLADGPELGARLGVVTGRQLNGGDWERRFPGPTAMLLVFVSPQCQTCNELMPHVKDFARAHRDVEVVLLSVLEHVQMNQAYAAYLHLEKMTYLIGAQLADDLNVEGTPYALYLSCDGTVAAKGLVNNYEHLLNLKEVAASREASPAAAGRGLVAQTGGV